MITATGQMLQIVAEVAGLSWMDRGLCAETDPDAWFVDKGGSTVPAKRVCRACPVRAECLDFAMVTGEQHGVWGGLSEQERRSLRRSAA